MTPEEKLFRKSEKRRVLLAGFNIPDAKHLKKYLFSRKIKNVDEVKNTDDALDKLQLLSYHFILLYMDAHGGKEMMDEMLESHRYDKTPIFLFSKSSDVFKGTYASRKAIIRYCSTPVNIAEFEKEIIYVMLKEKFERSLVGKISEAMDHYTKGCRAYDEDELEEAKEEIRLCLKEDPNFISGFIKMAEILIDMEDCDCALRVLTRAKEFEPNNSKIYFLIAIAELKSGKKEAANAAFKEAIKNDPRNVHLIIDIGNAFMDEGMIDEAIEYYELAKTRVPEYVYIYNRLGIALSRAGRFEKAEEQYNKALQIDENDAGIYFNMGTMWQRRNDTAKARKFFKKSLEMDPDLAEAKDMLKRLVTVS